MAMGSFKQTFYFGITLDRQTMDLLFGSPKANGLGNRASYQDEGVGPSEKEHD